MVEIREFATYKYQAGSTMNKLGCAAIISIFAAIAATIAVSPWFLLLLLVPLGIFIHIKRSGIDRPLVITSRYLILGERIVYFATLTRAVLDDQKQILTLIPSRGTPVTISADKFPTNARKPDKIRINRTAKFDKVIERILARLKESTPQVEVVRTP